MARGSGYKVPFRRKREGKTDYRLRKRLILARKPRFVPRFSLKNVVVQIVEAKPEGDYTLASAHARELARDFGWLGCRKNAPAAYLTGMLVAFRALSKGLKGAILDIGLKTPSRGCKTYAAVKGALDVGFEVPCDESVLPGEGRIRGEHIANYAKLLAESNPEKYRRQFSHYLKRGLKPEDLPSHFEEVKAKILSAFGAVK